jgi:ribosomal protein L22
MEIYVIGVEDLEERSLLAFRPYIEEGSDEEFFIDYSYDEVSELYTEAVKNAEENGMDASKIKIYRLVPIGTKLCECP